MIALIVAYDRNRVIGNKGKIPWSIPGEMKRFRDLTLENTVIMGRRTYEEIGRPLPGRETIVVSKTTVFKGENCRTVRSLSEALQISKGKNIFISGGAKLYEEILPLCEKLYITEIDGEFEGDTFFPRFDEGLFEREIVEHVEGDINYTYLTYTRK